MSRAIDDMLEQTRKEVHLEIAQRLLGTGKLSYEEIAHLTCVTIEEIKAIDAPNTVCSDRLTRV